MHWLVPLIALLAAIAASVGLFASGGEGPVNFTNVYGQTVELHGRGLYRHDSLLAGAGFRGVDAVTIFLALPLMLGAYLRARGGSQNAQLVLVAALFYSLYNGASMTFSAMFNSLFLVYVALFSASLFATIIALATFDAQALAARVKPGFPHRAMVVFVIVAGLGTLLIWLSEVIGSLLNGTAPALIGPYTTLFTHGFDSAVITPVAVLTGIQLWRRRPLGYLLIAPFMIFCALVGVVVIGQSIGQALAGLIFPLPVYIGMVGSWVVMGGFALGLTRAFFRHLEVE
ncbi:MAG: hypothetical protein N2318_08000 [Meiothermus sp.]|nr:hypothetical protein [Meiothermus sp.]